MTAWAPYPIHAISTRTCRHVGEQECDENGIPRYDENGNPYMVAIKSISCSPECEQELLTEHKWSAKPVLAKPAGIARAEEEEKRAMMTPQKTLIARPPYQPTVLSMPAPH